MNRKVRYSKCQDGETAKVAETAAAPTPEVIPFVSPEKAAEVFSSQRRLSWKEKTEQINRSLGRPDDSV
jgi:hypothetical protein